MSQYFPKPYEHSSGNVKAELEQEMLIDLI